MTKYEFSDAELKKIFHIHEISGPRAAYAYHVLPEEIMNSGMKINTIDVEDFIIQFYSQYNDRFGLTF